MGYQTYRIRRKVAENSYDILHVESRSNLVLRFKQDGTQNGNVETALTDLDSRVSVLEGTGGLGSKADKVAGAVDGNFAGLDGNGNLTDSGKKAADFANASHEHALNGANLTGTLPVSKGGTGKNTLTSGSYLVGAGTSAVTFKTPAQVLSDIGAAPSSHTHAPADLTEAVPVAKGGTGATDAAGARTNLGITPANIGAATDNHDHDSTYLKITLKGANNGLAELGADGKVPSSQLPSYVDDVIEADNYASLPTTGETGKIYVTKDTNKTYRWSGTAYVEISASLALGETSDTAYRGDRGKTAYDHSQSTHARTDATKTESSSTNGNIKINGTETTVYTHPSYTTKNSGLYKITVDSTGHVSAATAVVKADITALGIPGSEYTHPTGFPVKTTSGIYKYTVNENGHVTAGAAMAASDITALGFAGIMFNASQPSGQQVGDLWFETIS